MIKEHFLTRRVAAWLIFGTVVVLLALFFRDRWGPRHAPEHVQASGRQIIRDELAKLEKAPFGQTERGRRLLAEARTMLADGRIIFSSRLGGPRGITVASVFSPRRVYIKVLEMNHDKYLHQLTFQISEALMHEMLHAVRGGLEGASVEEEVDAFAAGVCADFASRGETPPELLTIDGVSIADFVKRSYPGASRHPDYQPLGEDLAWLKRRTGLDQVASSE